MPCTEKGSQRLYKHCSGLASAEFRLPAQHDDPGVARQSSAYNCVRIIYRYRIVVSIAICLFSFLTLSTVMLPRLYRNFNAASKSLKTSQLLILNSDAPHYSLFWKPSPLLLGLSSSFFQLCILQCIPCRMVCFVLTSTIALWKNSCNACM